MCKVETNRIWGGGDISQLPHPLDPRLEAIILLRKCNIKPPLLMGGCSGKGNPCWNITYVNEMHNPFLEYQKCLCTNLVFLPSEIYSYVLLLSDGFAQLFMNLVWNKPLLTVNHVIYLDDICITSQFTPIINARSVRQENTLQTTSFITQTE